MINVRLLTKRIYARIASECIVDPEAGAADYVRERKKQLLDQYLENHRVTAPGEKGGRRGYWMTKAEPGNRNHCHPIYGRTREELYEKIVAYMIGIESEQRLTVRGALERAVDPESKTGRRTLQRFDKNLGCLSGAKVSALSEAMIRAALDRIVDSYVTQKEFNESVTCLNKVAEYCSYEHISVVDIKEIVTVYRRVKLTGKHKFRPVENRTQNLAFDRYEAAAIVRDALERPSYRSIAVAMLILTGLRVGELLALEVKDVLLGEGYLWIHQIEDTKSYEILPYVKENRCREVYLSEEAKVVVRAALKLRSSDESDSGFLFLNENSTDGKLHVRAIDNHLRKHVHEEVLGYGLEREARSPHDCRRTYASLEYLNGTDIYTIRRQLGHTKITQTEEYIKDVVDAAERAGKLRGCGILQDPGKASGIAVYEFCTKGTKKKRSL